MSATIVSAVPSTTAGLAAGWNTEVKHGQRTILSVFPVELYRILPHAGSVAYFHPAAKKDAVFEVQMNPARLSVQQPDPLEESFKFTERPVPTGERGYTIINCVDTYQWVPNHERETQEPLPIKADIVANGLVMEWIQGRRVAAGRVGMRVLSPQEPFQKQLNEVWELQTQYFRSIVLEADGFFSSATPSDRNCINELHRKAAEWLGIENRDWCKQQEERRLKTCPACAERISANALVCKICSTFLPQFHIQNDVDCSNDTAVSEFIAKAGDKIAKAKRQ